MNSNLTRGESYLMRSIGRDAVEQVTKIARAAASEQSITRSFAVVTKVNSDGSIQVSLGDSSHAMTLGAVRATVDCASAKVGDLVVLDTYARVPLITGIVSTGSNGAGITNRVVLFDNASAALSGVTKLSSDCTKFDELEVWAHDDEGQTTYTKVPSPKVGALFGMRSVMATAGGIYVKSKTFAIKTTTTIDTAQIDGTYRTGKGSIEGSAASYTVGDYIGIIKVVGISY